MKIDCAQLKNCPSDTRPSQCMNRVYDSKIAIIGSVFLGVFGGGISYALTQTVEYTSVFSYPGKVAFITLGTVFGTVSGGLVGTLGDVIKWSSPPEQKTNKTSV